MKVLVLVTWTDCENKWRSLRCIGHEVAIEQYDDRPHDRHGEIVDHARQEAPDAIVYIGAVEKYHGRPCLTAATLCRLREIAPTIHLCNDASDEPWWPLLEEYDRAGSFACQVSIDGNIATPINTFADGLVKLTPVDVDVFAPAPWGERTIAAGMIGGIGHTHRLATIEEIIKAGLLDFRPGPVGRSYEEMAAVMCRTKVAFNYSMNGSGTGNHVKGRVVEAGMAGCCLLERANDSTRRWFPPDEYLEYSDRDHAMRQIIWARENDEEARQMAVRFAARVWQEHHPSVFWDDVFTMAGASQ